MTMNFSWIFGVAIKGIRHLTLWIWMNWTVLLKLKIRLRRKFLKQIYRIWLKFSVISKNPWIFSWIWNRIGRKNLGKVRFSTYRSWMITLGISMRSIIYISFGHGSSLAQKIGLVRKIRLIRKLFWSLLMDVSISRIWMKLTRSSRSWGTMRPFCKSYYW